MLSQNVMLLYC